MRIELEQAITLLCNALQPQQQTQTMALTQALHKHLARDIYAPINVPAFNRAAMDGYAVVSTATIGASRATPVTLTVVGEVMAGDSVILPSPSDPPQAVRIMTGAPIPDGYNAVLKQEDTDGGEQTVTIYAEIDPYTNYARMGEDMRQDQLVMPKGTYLSAYHLGVLAGLGLFAVEVLCPLRVGVITTGNELATTATSLSEGKIYDSNAHVLRGRLAELGVTLVFCETLADDIPKISQLIAQRIDQIDLLITTGGVSVGKLDILHDVVDTLGAERLFWQVNMRPGTPALASVYRDKLIVSLSGNPYAALTTFELLFRPLLGRFFDSQRYQCQRRSAILVTDFSKASPQRRLVRGVYDPVANTVSVASDAHQSSVLFSMLGCNCFVDIPAGTPALGTGTTVEIVLI